MTVVPSAEEKRIDEELTYPILLSERTRKAVTESASFKSECSEIGKQVDLLSHMLRFTVRFATAPNSASTVYDRPVRRIANDVSRNLERALSLVRKCRRRSFLHRVVNLVTAADFRKAAGFLDASIADMRWLLSVIGAADVGDGCGAMAGRERTIPQTDWGRGSGSGSGIVLSLPPIASNDPILSWVWSYIATVQMGGAGQLHDRVEAANELASLARDNVRNKKIIVEEGGVLPLLRLLKESGSLEGQVAAAVALYNVGDVEERVRVIVDHLGVGLIVQVLSDSPMKVQVKVADLVARMAEFDGVAKEEFARENVIRPLVSLLSFETFDDDNFDPRKYSSGSGHVGTQSFHSLVQFNKEKEKKDGPLKPRLSSSYSSLSKYSDGGSSRGGVQSRKERENESPEVKRELKISCARALWMLAKDSVANSRRITETKGLLCLAKLIEKEHGELQLNCLMAIKEITAAAEWNADLRRSAFKTNSPAAKAVVDQLLRVIKESGDPVLQKPAIRSLGSLSRTFPARETRVISPLVDQLSNKNHEVGTEAAIALVKFVSPDNFLRQEHSKAIIEFNGIIPLMRLLREGERAQIHGLILLCYLALHACNNEAIEQARVLTALEGAERSVAAQHPQLRELLTKAIYHLDLYRGDIHPMRQSSLRI